MCGQTHFSVRFSPGNDTLNRTVRLTAMLQASNSRLASYDVLSGTEPDSSKPTDPPRLHLYMENRGMWREIAATTLKNHPSHWRHITCVPFELCMCVTECFVANCKLHAAAICREQNALCSLKPSNVGLPSRSVIKPLCKSYCPPPHAPVFLHVIDLRQILPPQSSAAWLFCGSPRCWSRKMENTRSVLVLEWYLG